MMPTETDRSSATTQGVTRRDFLRVGSLVGSGLMLAELEAHAAPRPHTERAVILLMLVGGPSQLETFDPKPDAPAEVRGPFGSIASKIPGVRVSEYLPEIAHRLDRVTLLRSLHHDAAPIHETGHQLIQTGKLSQSGKDYPHIGALAAKRLGMRNGLPPFVTLPEPIGNTGVCISHGQTGGSLGAAFDPFTLASDPASPSYDPHEVHARLRQVQGDVRSYARRVGPVRGLVCLARLPVPRLIWRPSR